MGLICKLKLEIKMKIHFVILLFLLHFTCHSASFILVGEPSEKKDPVQQTITVGPKDADIIGSDNIAIQAAVDLLYFRGGGIVRILPGEYTLYNSIYLKTNVNLSGELGKTLIKRCPAVSSPLLVDADVGEKQIVPADASLFKVGMGIALRSKILMNAMTNTPLTINRIEDGVIYVTDFINHDFIVEKDTQGRGNFNVVVANIFPMLMGDHVENVVIDGLTIDSYTEEHPGWDNVRIGGIYFRTSKNSIVRNVHVSNTQGDGIFIDRASQNITVENSEFDFNTHHGVHPGSHSSLITVKQCEIHHNGSDGLYICWGIKNSRFVENIIHHNGIGNIGRRHGISIGHKDTHNIIEGNHIYENALSGIRFREKTAANGAHHNIIRGNTIENNGLPGYVERGYGIFIYGITNDVVIENNTIRETRKGDSRLQKNAVYISPGVTQVQLIGNIMDGHSEGNVVDKSR
jgi:hypothetical protein